MTEQPPKMKRSRWEEEEVVWDEERAARGEYTKSQLEIMANQIIREHARSIDPETGKRRGYDGDENPVLMAEHLHARKKREIIVTSGIPDPAYVSGYFNRSHPQGRPMNSPERRARGASFYRG